MLKGESDIHAVGYIWSDITPYIMKSYLFTLALLSFFSFSFAQNPVLEFDGIDDYVNLGTSAGNGVRTIELWFSPEQDINSSLQEFATLIGKEQSVQNLGEFTLAFVRSGVTGAGTLRFGLLESVSNANYVYSNSSNWIAGQWYHVAAVVHPVDGMMLFIDGIKQTSTNSYSSATVTSNDPTMLGCWGTLFDRYFQGSIDDVRLSEDALYTEDFAVPCPDQQILPSTLGLWNLNEGSGTLAEDEGISGYDATIFGASWSSAEFCGNAIYLDGNDDYVALGTTVGNGLRTIELWFRPEENINSSASNFSTLVAKEESIQNLGEFTLSFPPSGVTGAGTLRFGLLESVSDAYYVYSNDNSWTAGKWYHVAAVVHPTDGMMLFIDGIKQADTNPYNSSTVTSNDLTTIGCWGTLYDRYFYGSIDDVRFSTDALYTSDFTPPCPDQLASISTIGLWNFNEGMGSIAIDSSSNNQDGELVGATRISVHICDNSPIGSIGEVMNKSQNLIAFPNPSNGLFSIVLQDGLNPNAIIDLYDVQGRQILNQPVRSSSFLVDLTGFAPGIYTYNIVGETWFASGKLVKQ